MINALTIDVEDYFQVAAFDNNIDRADWHQIECRVEANTEKFMEVIGNRQVKATFFILGWVAEKFPNMVKRIAEAGHEIACHGFSHQLIYKQTPEEFRQETDRAKKLLEDLSQQPVDGYRAASFSITDSSLWALDIIAEAGFRYDSSIYPVRHDRYGLNGGPHVPYKIALKDDRSLIEFPITTVNFMGYKVPVGGGGYFRIYPFSMTKKLLKMRADQLQGPFVFYLHPWELDPGQPRVNGASLLSRFRHYYNLEHVESRLQRLLDTFNFGTMQEALVATPDFVTHSYQ